MILNNQANMDVVSVISAHTVQPCKNPPIRMAPTQLGSALLLRNLLHMPKNLKRACAIFELHVKSGSFCLVGFIFLML